jgi:hypothetical protein
MRRILALGFLFVVGASTAGAAAQPENNADQTIVDPVVARVQEHVGVVQQSLVRVIRPNDLPRDLWHRVKHLVAFRIHRNWSDGTTTVDPAIYLLGTSEVYAKAAESLRNRGTNYEYVWCLLAAVLVHEAAHTHRNTERQALAAEAAQLRRCLFAGHLYATDGWSAVSYLGKVEAKQRNPREHY